MRRCRCAGVKGQAQSATHFAHSLPCHDRASSVAHTFLIVHMVIDVEDGFAGGKLMKTEFEAAGALLAACALIILVACVLENVKAWGQSKRMGDLPAGALLGAASVTQMLQPIEPYPGFIFDLRIIPIILAGAFTSWRATALAATLAGLARLGFGGAGMWAGALSILSAAAMGYFWQVLRKNHRLPARYRHVALGGFATVSILSGALLTEPVRMWFFTNAAPLLLLVYLTVVPVLAWIVDCGLHLDSLSGKTARAAIARHEIELLSLPVFIHKMRTDAILGAPVTSAVLCLRLKDIRRRQLMHVGGATDTLLEAVLLRLTSAAAEFPVAGVLNGDTLLLPLTQSQLKRLEQIKDTIRFKLYEAPLRSKGKNAYWVSYELGLLAPGDFVGGGQLRPRPMSRAQLISSFPFSASTASRGGRKRKAHELHTGSCGTADLLFLKARHLMDGVA